MSEQTENLEPSDSLDEGQNMMKQKFGKPLAAGLIAGALTFVEMKSRGLKGNIVIDPPAMIPFLQQYRGSEVSAVVATGAMVVIGSLIGDYLADMMFPLEPANSKKSRYTSISSVTATTMVMHYVMSQSSVGARNPMLLTALVSASEFVGNMAYDYTVGSNFGKDADYDFYHDDFY